ncbi:MULTISPECIES: hypothetical protein [unclassified Streptomyces]|uniref:hypothetical protein n=1 Tax=unclassified Streptomyces TaxID=2593676 RepID=UPI00088C2D0D|nr:MULTISPECIES: hypothetical protein [unclassified Streptomyces]PBC85883.1 hypothetical protein BX261_5912 [Streptomyces sp. 2321.6]SDR03268.1 hypothetical protein SAMN05216511_1347 [Streptomyces sp. KS_16]SED81897.1 hypothetical protein SAMN05428940_5939 [Streptomyces sp. 2133.1]SED92740.1 hypothetical protein SAMN05428954_1371 [Streptomyces sp. 2112.3]SNC72764.1 hypothetical protein SAMN06272741_5840 [Streptomyces sp. 2114.4]
MPTQTSSAPRHLPRFEDAEPLGPQDAEFARDIKAVLEKHGNLDRFGLVLLHDHFSIGSDEVPVETNDPQARTLHVKVEKKAETQHAQPSQWRFLADSEETPAAESDSTPYEVLMLCLTLACERR